MTEHPLGDSVTIKNGLGEVLAEHNAPPPAVTFPSIADTILNLDELLSSDVRLAEKSARFCTKPDLEAKIEDLHAELDGLTDSQGRPLAPVDQSIADGGRSAQVVALEIDELQKEYAAAMRTVRLRQMDEDDWTAFMERHKAVLTELPPYPPDLYEDLIVRSAVAPRLSVEDLRKLRKKIGHPAFNEIADAAWRVNTSSGVSVPKSSLSSAVLRQQQHG